MFPVIRPRRLRRTDSIRSMVRETEVNMSDLMAPLFVVEGRGVKKAIGSLDGHYHFSPELAAEEAAALKELGIKSVLLFGIPEKKDEIGASSYDPNGVVQQAIRAIKEQVPGLLVVADLCFCEYTSHGHCGVLKNGDVDNDLTLVETAKQALSLAQAGADVIAPSGMMDGMVGTIREALDDENFTDVVIMSYAAKFASAFYGPFREAACSTPSFGDRRSYQMDPANAREALREIALDIDEGADIIMVKPALPYLDIIAKARESVLVPIAAYNVSGEYAMVKTSAKAGLIDGDRAIMESLTSIKRAGADIIISYFARDLARILRG